MNKATYDRFPVIHAPEGAGHAVEGWDAIASQLLQAIKQRRESKTIACIECYLGLDETEILSELARRLHPALSIGTAPALAAPEQIERLVEPFLGGEDPVFGFMCNLKLPQFFDVSRIAALRSRIAAIPRGVVLIVGIGAALVCPAAECGLLVYADLARWPAQNRFRRNAASNLGIDNRTADAGIQYKRAFFVDWRVCDRWKKSLIDRWDFLLDVHDPQHPKLVDAPALHRALRHAVTRPIRLAPFFDPGPWGGQWMKRLCDLDRQTPNFAWCFDCVPEENSLLLRFGAVTIEMPSLNLVFRHPQLLLGEKVHGRFGDEFPIRFDLLDTMGGGNLSLQVHPLTEYIQNEFGMHYTQDESYYLLDAGDDASVYLGLKSGIDRTEMIRDLHAAQSGGAFAAERYVNRLPAKKHDHFLIPAGTVHCSGKNSLVLEISATPYIFTFKMWDWGRLGLDGRPRPIHLAHGIANIQWERTTEYVKQQLVNRVILCAEGVGWREESTGLHEREFIETRRHWFSAPVLHDTKGGVNVLNLVEGEEAIIESPTGAFEPMIVHYAETFIVPAAVGAYLIRPYGPSSGRTCATIKAFVRTC